MWHFGATNIQAKENYLKNVWLYSYKVLHEKVFSNLIQAPQYESNVI